MGTHDKKKTRFHEDVMGSRELHDDGGGGGGGPIESIASRI